MGSRFALPCPPGRRADPLTSNLGTTMIRRHLNLILGVPIFAVGLAVILRGPAEAILWLLIGRGFSGG